MAHRNRWFTWVYLLKLGGFSMAMLTNHSVMTMMGEWVPLKRLNWCFEARRCLCVTRKRWEQWVGRQRESARGGFWISVWVKIQHHLQVSWSFHPHSYKTCMKTCNTVEKRNRENMLVIQQLVTTVGFTCIITKKHLDKTNTWLHINYYNLY